MGYKIADPILEKIVGKVVCVFDETEQQFESAQVLSATEFEKRYRNSEIAARGDGVVLYLQENILNDLTADWAGEDMAKTGVEISLF